MKTRSNTSSPCYREPRHEAYHSISSADRSDLCSTFIRPGAVCPILFLSTGWQHHLHHRWRNEGGGEEGGGNNNNNNGGGACTPGNHLAFRVLDYDASTSTCKVHPIRVDNCTGEIIGMSEQIGTMSCEMPDTSPPQHPCTSFSVGPGGITCTNSGWNVSARVTFPEVYLDVRPYPATLVRWPTMVRNGGMPESSGSGGVNYISNGGGSPLL